MLSRALGVATAILVMSVAAVPAQAQNLEAGKSPSQIFSGSCAVCHKSPRGLLKTVPPGSLSGFLRQHYTTSTDMASQLSAYVISNGANDPRGGGLTRQGQDLVAPRRPAAAAPEPAPAPAESTGFFGFGRRPAEPAQEAARPEEAAPMTPRQKRAADRAAKREAERAARPAANAPAVSRPAVLGEPPVPIEGETARPTRQKAAKKGRRGQEEPPKADEVKDAPKPAVAEPAPVMPAQVKPEPAKPESKEEVSKPAAPAEEAKPEAVKPETRHEPAHSEPRPASRPEPEPKPEAPPLRADPVPAVTPAPKPAPESPAEPATPAPAPASPPAPAPSAATPTPAPSATPAPSPEPAPAPRPTPPAPVVPLGDAAPPVSR